MDGVTSVHGRHYLLAAQYYKKLGQHADYYRTALRYLGCVELSTLSLAEQQEHALYLGLAALLGEKVYNIGELVSVVDFLMKSLLLYFIVDSSGFEYAEVVPTCVAG